MQNDNDGPKRTTNRLGQEIPEMTGKRTPPDPSSPMVDYAELGALSSGVEADAERALKVIRRGNLNDEARNDDQRVLWQQAADACRAVASELAEQEGGE